jgi:adenine-specific DNA-methyltransferase
LPEPCANKTIAEKTGFQISQKLAKRIRRAGKKIIDGNFHEEWNKDVGFRVLKIDTSNMADVYYAPDALNKENLELFVNNINPDRTPEDLLLR